MKTNISNIFLDDFEAARQKVLKDTTECKVENKEKCTITTVEIKNDSDSKRFNKEKGIYITVEMDEVYKITDSDFDNIVEDITEIFKKMISIKNDSRVLIVGIGNRNTTPDSLGPKTIDRIIVTRGFEKTMPELIGDGEFSNVSAITSNVFGITGVESVEVIEGITHVLKPSIVIVIDSLATTSLSRLCKTIQISNTSLIPGGGVGNEREKISSETIHTSMISIGMPTVMKLKEISVKIEDFTDELIITPINIDSATDIAAKLIAFSLNKALHYNISTEDILKFLY